MYKSVIGTYLKRNIAEKIVAYLPKWIKTLPNPGETLSEIENRIPLGMRMTTKEELGAMVAFLLSSKSSHTTGQLIYVDGGYVHLDRSLI
jgi:L-fucose dehydrogenase